MEIREFFRRFRGFSGKVTLLGIGPMSERVIRVSFRLARKEDFPLFFIASRNQIDKREFGAGYVCGWDNKDFAQKTKEVAREEDFSGIFYLCRDHGGPFQRKEEWENKISQEEAMERARSSYLADLLSNFNLFHIDPTKDPHLGSVPLDIVLRRTIEFIDYIEKERKLRNLPEVAYEVGTEETSGGLTKTSTLRDFIQSLQTELNKRSLPFPDLIVGQTGTLVRMKENVGRFSSSTTQELASMVKNFNLLFKEHNADYVSESLLKLHPALGIDMANVAPEFGVAETEGYLKLADLDSSSTLFNLLGELTLRTGRFRKWLTKDKKGISEDEIKKDSSLLDQIVRISGHYFFQEEEVKKEIERLLKTRAVSNPEEMVNKEIEDSIRKYVSAFNLSGLTTKMEGKSD